jgi:hypothetical protein
MSAVGHFRPSRHRPKASDGPLFTESGHNFKDIRGTGKLVLLCNRGV